MQDIRRSNERGYADHGWLKSFHTFSFADYFDPRAHGVRAAARDQRRSRRRRARASARTAIATWRSSATCSTASSRTRTRSARGSVIRPGDVQRMSAGRGVMHSEFNPSREQPVHFLQIWILPNARGIDAELRAEALRAAGEARQAAPDRLARRRGRARCASTRTRACTPGCSTAPSRRLCDRRKGRQAYVHVARGIGLGERNAAATPAMR